MRLLRAEFNSLLGRPTVEPNPFPSRGEERGQGDYTHARHHTETQSPNPTLAEHYAALEIPYGTDLTGVRRAYKELVKRYHPDRHQSAEKKATATEIVKRLNFAYEELVKHLEARPQEPPQHHP
ncbi:MAG: DnaJ domain-containing protein [Trueperaceae bacterium]|nr:MAG: DnaJ domain-containing protein [Trueperaceae bacterium]